MDTVAFLAQGFAQALTPQNLAFALIGSVLGTLVGVLPGIGPTSGIAILLPLTAFLPPTPAIIMLAAIYYGAMYGGSTTAILVNIPGEVASVVTTIDGYQMARQGRAGPALAIAAISSFVAGTLGLVGLTFFAPPLADFALRIGPPEYFGLVVLAFSVVVSLSGASLVKGLSAAALGALVALVGLDPMSGTRRFSYGTTTLLGGIDFIAVIIGLFAITEVLVGVEEAVGAVSLAPLGKLLPKWAEIKACIGTMLRATGVGFFLGLLPGCTPGAISFISYDLEKNFSKTPERFGKGAIEGVAAPEGANNATTSAGFVPLFALGIPATPALAVVLSGLMIYGLQPGPLLFEKQPQFVWTVIASMYVGNVMLLVLNLPLVGLWARLCRLPYAIMAPLILIFSVLGAFSVRNSFADVGMALVFGLVGYGMVKLGYPTAPMVLALILTPMLESGLRQSLSMAHGSPAIFLARPIALVLIAAGLALTTWTLYARRRRSPMARLVLALILVLAAGGAVADAQPAYPNRPVEIIVAYSPGGAADVAARLVAAHATKKWGQPVNVVNMPGASGITGALRALNARPDGYTLLLDPHATSAMLFAVESDVPFKMDGKTQIALVTLDPVIYTVKADSPWKTLRDVAEAAKASPKTFRYGIAGVSGIASFSVSQFLYGAGVNVNEANKVVFNGGAPTVTALAGGHIDFAGQQWSESTGLIQGGKIRGLAVVHPTRLPGLPDIPTAKEAGFPELNVVGWQGLAGPKGLPPAVVARWNALLEEAAKDPAFLEQAAKLNKVVAYMPPDPYWKFQEDELKKYLPLATRMGIRK